MASKIRVMIVDDHDLLRKGLGLVLTSRPDIDLIAEAADGAEAVRICHEQRPDVIIMDLKMPGMDGPTAIRLIHESFPQIRIIALTSFGDKEIVRDAIEAGATSYLLKNIASEDLIAAIYEAHEGKSTLAREAAQALIHKAQEPAEADHLLTRREYEVLKLMVKGMSNQEIADQLFISHSTVKKHVSNILTKLNTSTRAQTVALAMQNNLVSW